MARSFLISSCEPELRMGVTSCPPREQYHIIAGDLASTRPLALSMWLAHTSHCNSCQCRPKDPVMSISVNIFRFSIFAS